ncbi:ATP-binding cassette domain-containing protein [Vagococcus sp. BWB3-3]|uniref:ATP-binding cassette domain-containing protein n=1 Tax=Vagococcus allomyrinae TaxID=2794353 RepID=A0A940P9J9_9ENTE|nr:ATP-binding cassette domain-containing protein [Vagococcus allomyrinae]MBP1040457.1 ATP-binding cassette domain-containing protein [Vagococcus allomyrinae]
MTEAILEIQHGVKTISNGLDESKVIMNDLNLTIRSGDFITVLGGNGAGKSTLFNSIAGSLSLTKGKVLLKGQDISNKKEEERAKFISRVFQDPKMGTAPRMTVAENLLLAMYRGQKRQFKKRPLAQNRQEFQALCQLIGNGLEQHLDTPAGNLSGGQRQALSLLMATITKPELLLLDEHTAALDPKTSRSLMKLTDQRIQDNHLTCLMITHRMEDALTYGNRLIVLQKGQIKVDLAKEEKEKLTLQDLLLFFEEE